MATESPRRSRGAKKQRRRRTALGAARNPRAGRRAAKKEATRERIIAVALELFQSRGFDGTTTRAIARRAGIAEGTVFNYFPTKDDIALEFFERAVDNAVAAVRGDARLRDGPLEEKLFALLQSQFEYLEPYQRFIGSALMEAIRPASRLGPFSNKAQALRHRYVGFVEELFEQSLPPKRFVPLRFWAPNAFWVYYLGALLFWLNDESPGKENTLAFLDRSLKIGVAILRRTI
jgi:AcrR family transcriptional regulator